MGTRGAIGFRLDGQDKVTYNHFDSYPSGLGADILAELCGKKDWEKVKTTVRNIAFIDKTVPPTQEQIDFCKKWTDLGVSEQSTSDWYCLLRNAQGSLAPYLDDGLNVMADSHGFLLDSLFCEYAYIVNLDEGVLEFYKGFNQDPKGAGRYAALQEPPRKRPDGTTDQSEYYGIVLIDTIPLTDFPRTKRCKTFVNKTIKRWSKLCHEDDE